MVPQLGEAEIFDIARGIQEAESRRQQVERSSGENQRLRERVEALLRIYDDEQGFLESPAHKICCAGNLALSEIGSRIGRYRLLETIGEGGFGIVFLAEQLEPVRRKVALKIIKPGMDTRQVVARFEAERQALALMDHHNIAKVLDAGTTGSEPTDAEARGPGEALASAWGSGRPYFVVELVQGIPITDFCDQQQLSIQQRLELLVDICQAVQHAHQKGIIHRDIKPSNLLATLHDGMPVVKVID